MASTEQMARFAEEMKRGSKLPEASKGKKGSSSKKPSSLSRTKPNEVKPERRGFWNGEICTHLRYQESHPDFRGWYWCMCGLPGCNSEIEGFDEARRYFVPGHLRPRASYTHKGYRFGYIATLGPDEPMNVVPVDPSHNAKEFWDRHNEQPEWSESA